MRKKLIHWVHWSKTPIIVPRWLLTMKYAGFIILGILSALSGGLRTLNTVAVDIYPTVWSFGVIAVGAAALVGSLKEKWECHVEKWAGLVLFGLLLSWAFASMIIAFNEGDLARATGAFAILLLSMLPGVRSFSLLSQHGVGGGSKKV